MKAATKLLSVLDITTTGVKRVLEDETAVENHANRHVMGFKNSLQIFSIKHIARRSLPYGKWTCEDGREVVFNREYQPIFQRVDGVVSYANRDEFVENIVSVELYYQDIDSPVDFLTKHLGYHPVDASRSRACKKALLRSLRVISEFTPTEHFSVNPTYSLVR
jgi:hypothetical protein